MTKEELNKIIEEAPRDAKGRPVIPAAVFYETHSVLPKDVCSDDGNIANGKGGYLSPMVAGSERAKMIAGMGGTKAQENNKERRKIAETIDIFLKKTDENGVTMQEKIVEAMGLKAMEGCVGAFEAIRDTVGEKPSENVSLDVMTDGDKELMANLMKRLNDGQGSVKK